MIDMAKIKKERDLKIQAINDEYNSKLYGHKEELEQNMYNLIPEPIYWFKYDCELGEMSFRANRKLSKETLLKICESTMMDLIDFKIFTNPISTDDDSGLEQGIWLPLEYSEEYRYTFSSHYYCETRNRIESRERRMRGVEKEYNECHEYNYI